MGTISRTAFSGCFFLSLLLIHVASRPHVHSNPAAVIKTDAPIIGILAQDSDGYIKEKFGPTYIAASYIKYIESAGGRVVPIRVLFPGGGVSVFDSQYARTGKILFNLAMKANDAGDVFPLWGTCLGFEFLGVCGAGGQNVLSSVDGEDYTIPLNLSDGYKSSRLLGSAPEEIITYLRTANVTYNHHQQCVSTYTYYNNDALKKFYKVLSTNRDKEGVKEFVSTIEARDYPFYGVQWHPEKNPFEWTSAEVINHSRQAVLVTQYVADFFVNQARLSGHRFSSKEEEDAALIYQYNSVYCDPEKSHYEQCYIFK